MSDYYQIQKCLFNPFPLRNGNGTVENFLYRGFKDEYLRLCRYTCEENLSDLINGKWKVFQRWKFPDKHERGEYPGTLNFYFDSASKDIDWEYTNRERETQKTIKEHIKSTACIPAICLTKWRGYDDYFFWKSYTPDKNGICIMFKIRDLVKSIRQNDIDFIMSKMEYKDTFNFKSVDDALYSKVPSYRHEREYRIYLQNRDGSPIKCNENGNTEFKVDFETLNPTIIISPFADFTTRRAELIEKYPQLEKHIIKSKIIEDVLLK